MEVLVEALHNEESNDDSKTVKDENLDQADIQDNLGTCYSTQRMAEKSQLQMLNERLFLYIERIRQLATEYKSIVKEYDFVKLACLMKQSKLKSIFEMEKNRLNTKLNATNKQNSELLQAVNSKEIRLSKLRARLQSMLELNQFYENIIKEQEKQLHGLEAELVEFRLEKLYQDEDLIAESSKEWLTIQLKKLLMELESERLLKLKISYDMKVLEETMHFTKWLEDENLRDLVNMICKDSTEENYQVWTNEISSEIMKIKMDVFARLDEFKKLLDSKIEEEMERIDTIEGETSGTGERQSISEEINELISKIPLLEQENLAKKNIVRNSRINFFKWSNEFEDYLESLQNQLTTKVRLLCFVKQHLEKTEYQKTLRETEVGVKLVDETTISDPNSTNISMSEDDDAERERRYQSVERFECKRRSEQIRIADVIVSDRSLNGEYVVLRNVGSEIENLSGMLVQQTGTDSKPIITYCIPQNILSHPGEKIYIYANGKTLTEEDLEIDCFSWMTGTDVVTSLYDAEGREISVRTQ